jgi:hypothetical protein
VRSAGRIASLRIPAGHYDELSDLAANDGQIPSWLIAAADTGWGLQLESRPVVEDVLVREGSDYGFGRALSGRVG